MDFHPFWLMPQHKGELLPMNNGFEDLQDALRNLRVAIGSAVTGLLLSLPQWLIGAVVLVGMAFLFVISIAAWVSILANAVTK